MIVKRYDILLTKGELGLFQECRYRYFFYIANDWISDDADIVFRANKRCHQENLIQQLKNGLHALTAPVDNLTSNWAYMPVERSRILNRLLPTEAQKIGKTGLGGANRMA